MSGKQVSKPRLFLATVLWFAGVVLVTLAASAQDRSMDSEEALLQLRAESLHILGGPRNPIVRWGADNVVKLAIVGDVTPTTISAITPIFNEISLLTGIRYTLVDHVYTDPEKYLDAISDSPLHSLTLCDKTAQAHCANFVVLVTAQELMHKIATTLPLRPIFQRATARKDTIHCFFSPTVAPNLEIVQGVVWVDENLKKPLLNTCLQEEIYQSFGLFNDYSNSNYFSFNNQIVIKNITLFDKQLLSSLYDAAFRPGASTVAVVRQLVDYCRVNC